MAEKGGRYCMANRPTCKVTRDRNDGRKRLVLHLGDRAWHISDKEARSLRSSINKKKV